MFGLKRSRSLTPPQPIDHMMHSRHNIFELTKNQPTVKNLKTKRMHLASIQSLCGGMEPRSIRFSENSTK